MNKTGRALCGLAHQMLASLLAIGLCWTPVRLTLGQSAAANSADDSLRRFFLSPPEGAKPRVWWHWMNGNITQKGIKLDLEWMHRVGIGGIQSFDAGYSTPSVIDQRLVFMTPLWQDAFRYTATLADQLGLELAIAGSPGWSESGGPWVKPDDGMKKLVWTETRVGGGVPIAEKLPHPPSVIGPFQNQPIVHSEILNPPTHEPIHETYRDVGVVAYRLPDNEQSMSELDPFVTSSSGAIDAKHLWDGDFSHIVHLPYGIGGEAAWIQVDFRRPQTVQSMSLGLLQDYSELLGRRHFSAELQASTDGINFHSVVTAYDSADQSLAENIPPVEETVTFAPVTAQYFRLRLPTPPARHISPTVADWWGLAPMPTEHRVTQFVLHLTPRVDHFEQKAGFVLDAGINSHPTRHVLATEVIRKGEIIDLTSLLQPDGALNWTPPAGRWAILRLGYSLLGITNHPASPEGTGLEVDKLSRDAVKAYMDNYLGRYEALLGRGPVGSHALKAMVNDSWEAGPQNWTPELPVEFARRRGYDLRPWLPALTGRIINSAEETDRFLWDFRRTLGELLTESHYGQIAASLHARAMIHYGESHEISRAFIGDGMDVKRDDDIPMGAMWTPSPLTTQTQGDADLRESASVAHIYGQNIVAAESMTALGIPGAAYAFSPETLKPTADRELADGLNLFVVHTSVHQPLDTPGPGLTLGPFGQWFTRQETWAEQAGPWVTYLSRSAYLLQQGHFVADILYYYGQDSNITALYDKHLPLIPEGFAFDFANADVLTRLSVQHEFLVTSSGMRYRLLALDPRARLMSLDVLQQISQLVEAGATIVGAKPQATPSLADDAAQFHELADALWGNGALGEHRYGKGRVVTGMSVARAIEALKLQPDFDYSKPEPDAKVWFVHRHLTDGDLYFVNNRQARSEQIEGRFRVIGMAPELWHADTGLLEPSSYRIEGRRTVVPLTLDSQEAVFVVFRKVTEQRERQVAKPSRELLATVSGPWKVHFQSGRGAPEYANFSELESWTENADSGIKYFSGTASYETSVSAPPQWFIKGQRIEIDLGNVKNLAEILVDGESAGIAWKAPFRADVTGLLRPGSNPLTIRVTNLWPNRLIGDRQPNAKPVAFTTFNPYQRDSPLLESGLLGPVTILRAQTSR